MPPTAPRAPQDPAGELLDIVDEHDAVVGQAPRGEAYARGLRHRCVFIQARDADGRVFVHRRTPTKLVFPSMYDMFVGGVVGAGESYDDAALREAEEELGVIGLPRPVPLFKFLYGAYAGAGSAGPDGSATAANGGAPAAGGTWWSYVYEVGCDLPVHPQVEEVAWHAFLTEAEVERRLGDWPWVPDGLAAYHRLKDFRATGHE
jgi:8-oxo-dGTP pyrophosphatase MutT (NUDIX family)